MSNTLKLGNGKWATGKDTLLSFSDTNNNYKPLPFSFSRDSSATIINKEGLIETVGSGEPRIDFKDNTKGALLLEPSRTNVILQSQDITTGWTQGNAPTLTSNIAIAPDGTMTADGIQSETDGTYRTIRQLSISVSANSTVTNSYFVKKETSEINYGGFGFVFSGGTTKVVYGIVNSVNGTVTYDTDLTPTTKVEDYGSYWKISTTLTDTGANTSLGVYYYGTLSINGTSIFYGVGSVRTIWGMQLELNSSYPTSYIPTSGSAVTRVADSTSQTVPDGVIGQTEGTLFTEFEFNYSDSNTQVLLKANQSSDANSVGIEILGTTIKGLVNSQSSNIANIQGTIAIGTIKAAIAYKSNDIAFYVNGVQVGVITSGSIAFAGVVDILTIGHFSLNGGQYFPASRPFNQAQLYNTRLSNSELAALTTI